MIQQKFKALTYCGQFVDENLLYKGIYTSSVPFLRSEDTKLEDLTISYVDYIKIHGTSDGLTNYIENLSKCELTNVVCEISDIRI
jgi:hypothetical protein